MELIKRKPPFFLLVSFLYLVLVGVLKWGLQPPWEAGLFLAGGLIGVYFLDAAEVFFRLHPSPFRSALFAGLFVLVSLFVVTSSGSFLASGLVLSLYLSMILWLVGEWRLQGNIHTWFRLWSNPVASQVQFYAMIGFIAFFVLETLFFVQ